MKNRILITGASGFVGYHLVVEALKHNFDVFAAVRKSSVVKHLELLNIHLVYPNFNDANSLKEDITKNQYTYIIHAAGLTKALSEQEYNQINADYTYNLAAAASFYPGFKKFVLISSLAATGPLNNLAGTITENTEPKPVTAYGRSKLLAEQRLKSLPDLNYTILRPTGVYGPRDKDIFIMFKQIANGIEPYIGRFEQRLSLIYVTDLAKAAISALAAPKQTAYNLSDGESYSKYELGTLTKVILGKRTVKFHLPVSFVKLIAIIAEKHSLLSKKAAVLNIEKLNELMAVNWYCSIALAKSEINFKPAFNLKTGLTETLNWYLNNKWL